MQRTEEQCAAIFQELSRSAEHMPSQMLCIKLLELFCLLESVSLKNVPSPYFPKAQIELVKQIHDRLTNCPDCYISEKQLAYEHQISVAQLQRVFKQLYGVPIYQYARDCRLERAAKALRENDRSVTEIALDSGFANPGKFLEDFRKRYDLTPTRFRAVKKWDNQLEQPC